MTESHNINTNSTIIKDKGKTDNKIKIDFEKFKKGSFNKMFSLKNNDINYKEELLFEDNINQKDNQLNYTDRGSKIISNINKKLNNFEESSSSFLESSGSRKKNINNKQINSINYNEYANEKENNLNNKKRSLNKKTNFRNTFYNLGDINSLEKWNTIQINKSPKRTKDKNKEEKNIKHKGSITKRNSPKKCNSLYSNKIVDRTIHTSRSKNKNKTNQDSFILSKNKKINQIERYYNDYNEDISNSQINIDDEIVNSLDKRDFIDKDKDNYYLISDKYYKKAKKNNIVSINKIFSTNKSEENILSLKSSKLLRDFLLQINMDKYLDNLAVNGFDDINLILDQSKNGGASIQDNELKEAGISIPGDRAKILIRIQELSNNFPFTVPKEVYHKIEDINKIENDENIQKLKKWLENLKVEDYLINFIYSGYHSVELLLMQMISYNPLTSEMLKEEIGIDKIGYRSRIINKLKDEARSFLGQLKTKTLVINKGAEDSNNCQCVFF